MVTYREDFLTLSFSFTICIMFIFYAITQHSYFWKPKLLSFWLYPNTSGTHASSRPSYHPVFPLNFTYLPTCTHPYWLVKHWILSVHKMESDVCLCTQIMQCWKEINLCIHIGYKKTLYLKCSNKCKTVIYLEHQLYRTPARM